MLACQPRWCVRCPGIWKRPEQPQSGFKRTKRTDCSIARVPCVLDRVMTDKRCGSGEEVSRIPHPARLISVGILAGLRWDRRGHRTSARISEDMGFRN